MSSKQMAFSAIHADDLMDQEITPRVQVVEGLILDGVTLFCGGSKIGKSWAVLDLCCSVATGRPFLGRRSTTGDVLYCALEDDASSLQERLKAMGENPPHNLLLATEAPTLSDGFIGWLESWVKMVDNPRLVVIDTLQCIRGMLGARANLYQADYQIIRRFKEFAKEHRVAVILIHHISKGKAGDDRFERISGSNGLMGAADTAILLSRPRGSDDALLSFVGRSVWGDDVTLRFSGCRWRVIGEEAIARESYEADPIVQTARALLAESFAGRVQITLQDFKDAVAQRCGVCPAGTLTALARMLSARAPDFLRFDKIILERPRTGSKTGVRFTKGGQD